MVNKINGVENKDVLRKYHLRSRNNLSIEEVTKKSDNISNLIIQSKLFKKYKNVMFYNSKHKEVNLGLAANYSINNSDVVIFPCVNNQSKMIESYMINSLKEDFVQGSFGIIEPINEKCKKINPRDIDLIFIPGIVFDLHGNRIGYGKGFYDKFLKSLDCLKVGVAYQSQIVDNLNFLISDFDIKMDYIITEKGMVNCKNE